MKIKYCKGFLNLYHIHFIGKMYFDDDPTSVDPLNKVEMILLADDGKMILEDNNAFEDNTHHVKLIPELEYNVMKCLAALMQKTFARGYIKNSESEPTELESLDLLMKHLRKYKKELKEDEND